MILNITSLKKGTLFQLEGEPYRVVDYAQKVMGRGSSIVNIRAKSLTDGKVLDKTFKGNEQLSSADVNNRPMQYLYNDGLNFFFMDESTFEQYTISAQIIGDQGGYLREGTRVQLQFFNGQPINVDLPNGVPLQVTYTENVTKGDTANSITKNAELESGITIKVPAFIKQGDVVKVDTRSGAYLERAKA